MRPPDSVMGQQEVRRIFFRLGKDLDLDFFSKINIKCARAHDVKENRLTSLFYPSVAAES